MKNKVIIITGAAMGLGFAAAKEIAKKGGNLVLVDFNEEALQKSVNELKDEFPDKIKEVRGKGLLTAFEMHNHENLDGHIVSVELLKRGVYAKETHHSTVRIAPALTIEAWQIDNLAEAIRDVISSL